MYGSHYVKNQFDYVFRMNIDYNYSVLRTLIKIYKYTYYHFFVKTLETIGNICSRNKFFKY